MPMSTEQVSNGIVWEELADSKTIITDYTDNE